MTLSQTHSHNQSTAFVKREAAENTTLDQVKVSDRNEDDNRRSGESDSRQEPYPSSQSSNRLNVSDLLSSSGPSTKTSSVTTSKQEESPNISSPQHREQSNEMMMIDKRPTTGNSTNASIEGTGKPFMSRQRSVSSAMLSDSHSRRPITPSGATTEVHANEGVTAYHYAAVQQITEHRENIEYILNIREQPKHSRMCGVGEKADRRPIDPAPIIQLRVITHETPRSSIHPSISTQSKDHPLQQNDRQTETRGEPLRDAKSTIVNAQPSSNQTNSANAKRNVFRRGVPVKTEWGEGWEDKTWYLENPYYFMYAMLADAENDDELHLLSDGKTRYTTGSCVSCLYHLKDIDGSEQGFFVFPDLSIRVEGRYRLKLCLFETIGHEVHHCKSIYSKPFNVYTAKRFPGMEESTMLSKSFADQGLKVRVRKNPRARRARAGGKRKDAIGGSEDESEGEMYGANNEGNPLRRTTVVNPGEGGMGGGGGDRGYPKRMKGEMAGGFEGTALPNPVGMGPGRGGPTMYGMNSEVLHDDRRSFTSPHENRLPPHPAYNYPNEGQQNHPSAPMQGYNAQRGASDVYQTSAGPPPPGQQFTVRHSGSGQRGMQIDPPLDPRHGPRLSQGPPPMAQQYGGHGVPPGDVEMGRDPRDAYMRRPVMDRHPHRDEMHQDRYYGGTAGYADERGYGGHGYADRRGGEGMRHYSGPVSAQSERELYNRERQSAAYYEEQDQLQRQRRLSGNAPPTGMHSASMSSPRQSEYGNAYHSNAPPPDMTGRVGGGYRYEDRDVRSSGRGVELGNVNGRPMMKNEALDGARQRLPPLHVALSPETSPRQSRTIVPSPSGPTLSSGSSSGGGYGQPAPSGSQRYPSYPQHQSNEVRPPQSSSHPSVGPYGGSEHGHLPRHHHGSGMTGPPLPPQQQQQPPPSGQGGRMPPNSQPGYQMPPPQPSHQYGRRM